MLLIHSALHAEARALIDHFKLKRQHDEHAFACFYADDIWLVESGIGKTAAAAAISYLASKSQSQNPICLNIGLAGHANLPVGKLIRAQRIEDSGNTKRWYPANLFDNAPQGENLLTLDQPCTDYPEDTAVDMEASGFFSAALHFTTLELVQSLKIISDNRDHLPRRFKTDEVDTWMGAHLEEIDQFIEQLRVLRSEIVDTTFKTRQAFLERWHFSQYQQGQLQRLLQRHAALYPGADLLSQIPAELNLPCDQSGKQSKAVLRWIEELLDQTDIHY